MSGPSSVAVRVGDVRDGDSSQAKHGHLQNEESFRFPWWVPMAPAGPHKAPAFGPGLPSGTG